MGIKDKFIKKSTDKIGNKMLKIDPVVGKGRLPKNKKDLAKRRERAEELVRKKALLSSSASVIPIPGLDFGVDLKLM
ncbi:MAG: DUF697 domain-containing protein, partial [Staphylococcus simulans]|nr:DUF697 domain-containing protein [Staphylococcus simulans]